MNNYILVLLGAYLSLFNQTPENSIQRDSPQVLGSLPAQSLNSQWNSWKAKHNKSYSDEIDPLKRIIFEKNLETIINFNEKMSEDLGFELGPNHMTDMSGVEMQSINGYKGRNNLNGEQQYKNSPKAQAFLDSIFANNSIEIPDEVDWRKTPGRVSPVKNQGQCGSCWAFASTGVLEGQEAGRKQKLAHRFRDTGKLVELSEQNLVDCVKKDYGCNGGIMIDALDFVKEEGGIDDEQSYPYEALTRKCRFNKSNVAFTDNGGAVLPSGDEQKLKEVVAKYGPVAVAIDASSIWFQLYRKGVYINKHCKNKEDELDHGVLVVGYGTDPKKGDYWIVKNSWGARYGEKGYIRMARNRNNMCGIATAATIATF